MIYIIATIVIIVFYIIFNILWKSILFTLFVHIPHKLKTDKTEKSKQELRMLLKYLLISILLVISIFSILYFLFIKYDFDYSISAFIGSVLALFGSMSATLKLRSVNKMFDL